MNKISIITLISTIVLSTNPVFADTNTTQDTNTTTLEVEKTDAKVEAIIAEIEEAKTQTTTTPETIIEKTEPETVETTEEEEESKAEEVKVTEEPKTVVQSKEIEEIKQVPEVQTTTLPTVPKVNKFFITMPEVPKAIDVHSNVVLIDKDGNIITKSLEELYPPKKEIFFSDRVAPDRFKKKKKKEEKVALVGDINNARVTAYLHSPLLSVDEVSSKLKDAGFDILSTYKVDKKGRVVSIVYTNEAIKKAAAKHMRGFAGTLRIVIDEENKLVNISNPIYLMKAFMQKEYDAQLAEATLAKLRDTFSDLKASSEIVKFSALERYQFMENMPYYQDMQVIAKAKNEELLQRANDSKKVLYVQHLENGSVVLGMELGDRTSRFVKKIGYENAGLLPYPVLIEKGEAKMLAPQYYIAVMYPMLKMSKFMTIATVPGAIGKDLDRIFR